MKRIGLYLVLVLLGVMLVGCGQEKQPQLNWSVAVVEQQVKEQLETVDQVHQYDGSVAKVSHLQKPGAGKKFLLLQLKLKKNVAGNHGFQWKGLQLQGKDKTIYERCQDVFLGDYHYKRLPATELQLDAQGWVCFEIPVASRTQDLQLVYQENGKQNTLQMK